MRRRNGIKGKLLYILNIVLPLLIGLFIYINCRPNSYIALMTSSVIGLREHYYTLPPIINNYVPDYMWAYALMFVVYRVVGIYKRNIRASICISIVFSVLTELFQLFQSNIFTFDGMDIAVEIMAITMASIVIKLIEREGKI